MDEQEAKNILDVADLALRMKAHGIDDEKITLVFQSAKEDGKISEEDLAKALDALKTAHEEEGEAERDEERADAEKAFGMKFLD